MTVRGGIDVFNILCGLLSRENTPINNVIDYRTCTHRDLSVVELRYVQGAKYKAAYAFYTDTWIAKTPLGPSFNVDGTLVMNSIDDVANVYEYPTVRKLKNRPWPDSTILTKVQEALDVSALQLVKIHYPMLNGILYKASFNYVPVPTIQVCLARGTEIKTLLGTVAIDIRGKIYITSKVDLCVDEIVGEMKSIGIPSLVKELGYE